jgi:peptide/nickel transport system permease protein/oligopeptide transport system permease protein
MVASVVVIFAIVTVVFFLAHASPNDPIYSILGRNSSVANVDRLRREFGLDQPEWRQYLNYLGGLLHGNLGRSEESGTLGTPVWTILQTGVPVTLKLGGYALILSLMVGLPVGLVSALNENSIIDHVGQATTMILFIAPSFVLVPMCQLVFGDTLHWLPVTGWGDPGWTGIKEMVLPVVLFAIGMAGFFAKSFRSFLLEVFSEDYIRTANAKGLQPRRVWRAHAMKNTLVPLASIVGPAIGYLILGAFVIEYFFSIPGIAYITVNSVTQSDYDVVEGTTIVLTASIVLVNMLTDIFTAMVDPRISL